METHNVEYKTLWRDEFLKELCAFANTDGGTLFIGRADSGNIIGIPNPQKLLEDIPNKVISALDVYPKVILRESNNKHYVEIIVEPTSEGVFFKGKYFIRVGSTTQEIKGAERKRYLIESGNITWDELPEKRATLDDINFETIKYFQELAIERVPSIHKLKDPIEVLEVLNLYDGTYLTRAAILLFGKKVSKFYTSANLKIGRFVSYSDVITDDLIEGNLFEQLDKAIDILRTKYVKTIISYDDIVRRDKLEYPKEGIREAIINSLIHREYPGQTILISVFDNGLEIWNNGPLPKGISIDELGKKHKSVKRNKLCAEVFYKAGLIESWGKGTVDIVEEAKEFGLLPMQFKEEADGLTITFRQKENLFDTVSVIQELDLNDRQKDALEHFRDKGEKSITNEEYRNLFDVSERTATNDLKELVEKGIVERQGKTAGTKYYLLEKFKK